jgi:dolichyl-phosphate-mannose--protein O-mannosyl transferase
LPPAGLRRDVTLALLVVLAAAACRLPRLGFPDEEVFDEVYHAKSALQYLKGEEPIDWVHPPTSKLLIAVGVAAFGYHGFAWRLAPALAGIALAAVFFFLARLVLPSERATLIACALLLCDGVYLVQSRMAMTNIFAVLFQLGSTLFFLRAGLSEPLSVRDMLIAGTFLGLALSTRWTSLFATAFIGSVLLVLRGWRLLRLRELALLLVSFAVIPALLYVLSYMPWMHQGHTFMEVVRKQESIWNYHATLDATHPYFSAWYTWPWLYRPTLYYFKQIPAGSGPIRGILALGNPALWWVSVPVTLWALITGIRERDPRRLFCGMGFCGLYLPWGLSPRTLNFSHYMFEAVPYACLSLGLLLDQLWENRFWAPVTRGYLLLVFGLFVFFFPFMTGLPIPTSIFYYRLGEDHWLWWWFSTWI